MEHTFINLVQKCIYLDFLVNSIIISNYSINLNLLKKIIKENLRNIKIIYKLYKYIFNEDLILDNNINIKFNTKSKNKLKLLYNINLDIIVDLKFIANYN